MASEKSGNSLANADGLLLRLEFGDSATDFSAAPPNRLNGLELSGIGRGIASENDEVGKFARGKGSTIIEAKQFGRVARG